MVRKCLVRRLPLLVATRLANAFVGPRCALLNCCLGFPEGGLSLGRSAEESETPRAPLMGVVKDRQPIWMRLRTQKYCRCVIPFKCFGSAGSALLRLRDPQAKGNQRLCRHRALSTRSQPWPNDLG